MSDTACFIFAGPTLYGSAGGSLRLPANVCLRPPAGRGDIAILVGAEPPGVLALVDGVFHSRLAVGHEELRSALEAGWQAWGLGSMGAIRAYEMRHMGMRGFGQVYARFETEFDFQDDEVALLHTPAPPYQAISEPLIHLRAALEHLEKRGLLSCAACAGIATRLKNMWYGDRTLRFFTDLTLAAAESCARQEIADSIAHFASYRLKTCDLETFLRVQPWCDSGSAPHSARSKR